MRQSLFHCIYPLRSNCIGFISSLLYSPTVLMTIESKKMFNLDKFIESIHEYLNQINEMKFLKFYISRKPDYIDSNYPENHKVN